MYRKKILIIFLLCGCNIFDKTGKKKHIGINLFQLPSTTLNANYSVEYKPYFTPLIDLGYTFNFVKGIDLPRPTYALYDGYKFKSILGGYFNLRKSLKKMNYFHLGLFSTNAWVNEMADYDTPGVLLHRKNCNTSYHYGAMLFRLATNFIF